MTTPYYQDDKITLWHGHSLTVLRSDELGYDYRLGYAPPAIADGSVDCVVTSPPYFGLRDYGQDGQYGLEQTPAVYVEAMRELFAEVHRILVDTGTLWLNIGDSYYRGRGASTGVDLKNPARRGFVRAVDKGGADWAKPKNLLGIPWRVAFALQDDGWILRNDIIWGKPNAMPESVTDRLANRHEHVFMFSKSRRYTFNLDAIRETHAESSLMRATRKRDAPDLSQEGIASPNTLDPQQSVHPGGKNPGDVWWIGTRPFSDAHFAVMPIELARRCVAAGGPQAGKRCDCDDVIRTPLGEADEDYVDYTQQIGRAGLGRSRRPNEGVRPLTKREQRFHAEQLRRIRQVPDKWEHVKTLCGSAVEHYIRVDDSGARALPPDVLDELVRLNWMVRTPDPCDHPVMPAGVVFDPFSGSGTTGLAAMQLGLRYVGIDLSADYLDLSLRTRFAQDTLDFEGMLA